MDQKIGVYDVASNDVCSKTINEFLIIHRLP